MRRLALPLLLFMASSLHADSPRPRRDKTSLDVYLARIRSAPVAEIDQRTAGSLWVDSGLLSDAASDHRARAVGDLVTIQILELTTAETSASVNTQRKFEANSGIDALPGKIKTSGVESLFSPHSAQALQGQGQTTANSKLETALSGRVVAMLPGGALVVEAQRDVLINNQRNRLVVRGVARPTDITSDDSIISTKLSDLEVELTGKGVVSDGTRQPNLIMRWLLRLLNF